MRRIVTWAALAVAIAVPAYLAGQQGAGADYQKVMADLTAAYSNGDAAAIAASFAEDGLQVGPDGSVYSGRAAVLQNYTALFAGPMKGATIKLTPIESRQLTPDIQIVVGTVEVTRVQGGAVLGRYISTLVRKDGKWEIVGTMSMSLAAPQ
jgi:uncharacterized protein (TIGR02246 family)